jgi:hypothetical protein
MAGLPFGFTIDITTFMAETELRPGQSTELLKALHILTRDGKMNQDSRRKLKQVYHLFHFIEPLLQQLASEGRPITLVDHGAGNRIWALFCTIFFSRIVMTSRVSTALRRVPSW